jgi:hypothetical protein
MVNAPSIQRRHYGLSGSRIPSSVNQSTSRRQPFPQGQPLDPELSTHAPFEGIPHLSASLTSHQISHFSLETQSEFMEVSRGIPQASPKPIEVCATSPCSGNTSSEHPAKHPRVRYRCEICRKEFAQKQGVGRHRLEKHEPYYCLYCPTFRWGRLYLLKQHLKKKHPEVDLATATLDMARRSHRSDPIPTINRAHSHDPPPRSTSRRRSHRDNPRAMVRSSPTGPRLSPSLPCLDPFPETLDIGRDGASLVA